MNGSEGNKARPIFASATDMPEASQSLVLAGILTAGSGRLMPLMKRRFVLRATRTLFERDQKYYGATRQASYRLSSTIHDPFSWNVFIQVRFQKSIYSCARSVETALRKMISEQWGWNIVEHRQHYEQMLAENKSVTQRDGFPLQPSRRPENQLASVQAIVITTTNRRSSSGSLPKANR